MPPPSQPKRKTGTRGKKTRIPLTTHILHRDLELLPVPLVLSIVHLHHDLVDFTEPRIGLGTQAAPPNEVPTVFRDFALDAFGFDIVQPSVDDGVFLSDTPENGGTGVLPLSHGGLEVKRLSHDGISDSGHVLCVSREVEGVRTSRGGGRKTSEVKEVLVEREQRLKRC